MRDNPNLDLLRSIAVALVVVSHLGGVLRLDVAGIFDLPTFGRVGVAVFFVHTTLVLMMSMQRQGNGFAPFMVRRLFRIYPLAIVIVLVMGLLHWRWGTPVSAGELLTNVLLVQNLTRHDSVPGQLWSLAYEVQMYLLLPALFAITQLPRALLRIGLLWAGSVLLVLLAVAAGGMRYDLLKFIPCFLPGIIAFLIGRAMAGPEKPFGPMLPVALVVLGAGAIPALVASGVPESPLLWALCLALGVVIPFCRPLQVAPIAHAAKTVATYSYGIYLTHLLCVALAFGSFEGSSAALQWTVFFVSLVVLSVAAYRWIERPGIAAGVRLADRMVAERAGVSAVRV